MSVISWIILGLIAGFVGSKIVNRQGQGLMLDIALGVVGAIVGGVLFSFFWCDGNNRSQSLKHARRNCWLCSGSLGLPRLRWTPDRLSSERLCFPAAPNTREVRFGSLAK